MVEKSLLTRTEREIYLDYERQRRVQMLRIITPAFIVVSGIVLLVVILFLLAIPVPASAKHALLITAALLAAVIVMLVAGLLAGRGGHLELATFLVAGTSALGTTASLAVWGGTLGLDPFAMIELTPFAVVIVLSGVLGNIRTILVATVVMNAATVLLLLLTPQASGLEAVFSRELPLIVAVSLVYQWLFAALMIAIWLIFQRSLSAVGSAYERAKQLDQLKDEFISSVNHELRTPLMTMQTYLETLRTHADRVSPEQLAAVLDHVCRVSDSLVDLVKSILSARRIDQDMTSYIPVAVSLRQALTSAIHLIDPREVTSGERDLRLDIAEDLRIWAEPIRVQQILTNLLSNAIKYSPPATPIEVTALIVREPVASSGRWGRGTTYGPAMADITVRDYGHGIPPDQIPLLFNRFVRLPRDLASNVMGTGLGLYLCRVLAESMGGRIWVESTGVDGEGTTFHLILPLPPIAGERVTHPPRVAVGVDA